MQRKAKRSSILKPPRESLRAPLLDLDSLQGDDDDNYTQPSSRRVSFSRTSQVKEFDPTIGNLVHWNYEETVNIEENDENYPKSVNVNYEEDAILPSGGQKLRKRKSTNFHEADDYGSDLSQFCKDLDVTASGGDTSLWLNKTADIYNCSLGTINSVEKSLASGSIDTHCPVVEEKNIILTDPDMLDKDNSKRMKLNSSLLSQFDKSLDMDMTMGVGGIDGLDKMKPEISNCSMEMTASEGKILAAKATTEQADGSLDLTTPLGNLNLPVALHSNADDSILSKLYSLDINTSLGDASREQNVSKPCLGVTGQNAASNESENPNMTFSNLEGMDLTIPLGRLNVQGVPPRHMLSQPSYSEESEQDMISKENIPFEKSISEGPKTFFDAKASNPKGLLDCTYTKRDDSADKMNFWNDSLQQKELQNSNLKLNMRKFGLSLEPIQSMSSESLEECSVVVRETSVINLPSPLKYRVENELNESINKPIGSNANNLTVQDDSAFIEGMEFTVPVGKLLPSKFDKTVAGETSATHQSKCSISIHSSNQVKENDHNLLIDHKSTNLLLNDSKIVAKPDYNNTANIESVQDDTVYPNNSVVGKSCMSLQSDIVHDTTGLEFTAPLGKLIHHSLHEVKKQQHNAAECAYVTNQSSHQGEEILPGNSVQQSFKSATDNTEDSNKVDTSQVNESNQQLEVTLPEIEGMDLTVPLGKLLQNKPDTAAIKDAFEVPEGDNVTFRGTSFRKSSGTNLECSVSNRNEKNVPTYADVLGRVNHSGYERVDPQIFPLPNESVCGADEMKVSLPCEVDERLVHTSKMLITSSSHLAVTQEDAKENTIQFSIAEKLNFHSVNESSLAIRSLCEIADNSTRKATSEAVNNESSITIHRDEELEKSSLPSSATFNEQIFETVNNESSHQGITIHKDEELEKISLPSSTAFNEQIFETVNNESSHQGVTIHKDEESEKISLPSSTTFNEQIFETVNNESSHQGITMHKDEELEKISLPSSTTFNEQIFETVNNESSHQGITIHKDEELEKSSLPSSATFNEKKSSINDHTIANPTTISEGITLDCDKNEESFRGQVEALVPKKLFSECERVKNEASIRRPLKIEDKSKCDDEVNTDNHRGSKRENSFDSPVRSCKKSALEEHTPIAPVLEDNKVLKPIDDPNTEEEEAKAFEFEDISKEVADIEGVEKQIEEEKKEVNSILVNETSFSSLPEAEEFDLPVTSEVSSVSCDKSSPEQSLCSPTSKVKPFLIEDWIKEESSQKGCPWKIHKLEDNQWSFLFFYGSIKLTLMLKSNSEIESSENKTRAVDRVELKSCLIEGNRDSDYAVHRVFLSRCSIAHMQSLCPSTEQIPELFTYLNQESENMTALYNQATILSKRYPVIFKDNGFFFSIGSFKLMRLFYVKVNLLNWKDGSISPNDVTVVNKIGHTRDREMRAVLKCTKRDENFLPNFFVGVHHYIKQFEDLED